MSTRIRELRFLTRSACSLCEEAHNTLRIPARVLGVRVEAVDVDADPGLSELYGSRVPVVAALDGRVLAEGRISRRDAWRSVWEARRG
jgi:hypothetical protein